ncbi:hypothetical protein RyT2_17050 [Pseudolactococcus yaeyamensis]
MVTIKSNFSSAQSAISELVGIDTSSLINQTITVSFSNLSSLTTAQTINNELLNRTAALVEMVLEQAQKFPEIAAKFEEVDLAESERFK